MDLKDSKTKENLMKAFAGESQARNRYNISAKIAKDQGLYIIKDLFDYTAEQERAHAQVFYHHLKEYGGSNINISGGYPVDIYDTTAKLLKSAQHNEYEEWEKVYKEFGNIAQEEGFSVIAKTFENIASIEKVHGDRFGRYADEIERGMLFRKDEDAKWMCTNCGYIYEGKEAPKLCPVCKHPQGYFMIFENSLFE